MTPVNIGIEIRSIRNSVLFGEVQQVRELRCQRHDRSPSQRIPVASVRSAHASTEPTSAAVAAAAARTGRDAARRTEGLDGAPLSVARSGAGLHVPALSRPVDSHERARRRVAGRGGRAAPPLARELLDVRGARRDRPLPLGLTSRIGNPRVTVTHGLPNDAGDPGRSDEAEARSSGSAADRCRWANSRSACR